ncbi:MAG TPA: glutamate--tRNA ligase [Acidobacteriota bacterium]|nr:glutamate--tRNA ligase [Acidobacteriota bacterium]
MNQVRVRFAPSPTGYLHVGNARTALFNWLFARQNKGVYILRIEDTDIQRSEQQYEHQLIKDLQWMGLNWDEGPDKEGDFGPYRQSLRMDIYVSYANSLIEEGKAYYCFCKPEELKKERDKALAAGKTPVYSGRCRGLPIEESKKRIKQGEEAVIRLLTPDKGTLTFHDMVRGSLSFQLALIGDPVLIRSNGHPSYNYAVVVDDALMKISHVIRGEDHIINTVRQLLLYKAFQFDPPQFAHLSMVMGKDNTRLSKRHGATSVHQFSQEGILPSALFNYLALLGWSHPQGKEVLSIKDLIESFDLKKASRSSAVFDYDKLYWINREHIKSLSNRQKAEWASVYLKKAGYLPKKLNQDQWDWLERAVADLMKGVNKFSELPEKFALFFDFSPEKMEEDAQKALETDCGRKVIKALNEKLDQEAKVDFSQLSHISSEIKKDTGCRGKELFHPLRVAITAQTSGLELDKFIPLLEEGSRLNFPIPIKSCAQRVAELSRFIQNI